MHSDEVVICVDARDFQSSARTHRTRPGRGRQAALCTDADGKHSGTGASPSRPVRAWTFHVKPSVDGVLGTTPPSWADQQEQCLANALASTLLDVRVMQGSSGSRAPGPSHRLS